MVGVKVMVGVGVEDGRGVKLGVGVLGVKPIGVLVGVSVFDGDARMNVLVGGGAVVLREDGVSVGMMVWRPGARWTAMNPAQ